MAEVTAPAKPVGAARAPKAHPLWNTFLRRLGFGVITLFCVSILVFAATQVLPGNAASAVLQNTATPQRLHALELQMHLNRPAVEQYWTWLTGILHGNFGTSLANGAPVSALVGGRI